MAASSSVEDGLRRTVSVMSQGWTFLWSGVFSPPGLRLCAPCVSLASIFRSHGHCPTMDRKARADIDSPRWQCPHYPIFSLLRCPGRHSLLCWRRTWAKRPYLVCYSPCCPAPHRLWGKRARRRWSSPRQRAHCLRVRFWRYVLTWGGAERWKDGVRGSWYPSGVRNLERFCSLEAVVGMKISSEVLRRSLKKWDAA